MIERKGMPRFEQMNEKYALKYAPLFKRGMSHERVAELMIEDERAELKAAEIESPDRAAVEIAVEYGAKELGIRPPRVRFFDGKGFDFGGITYRDHLEEIWVAGDRPWYEQGELALHELAHVAHIPEGLPKDVRETDARRFAARGLHWIHSAARAAR